MADLAHESVSAPESHLTDARVRTFSSSIEELEALRSRCGVFDPGPRARIVLTGEDRIRWLNGMVTNNVRDLAVGHGVYSFLLNPQGHILADMTIYNRGEYLLVDTDLVQAEKIRATFDHYIIMDDVELGKEPEKLATIGVHGPRAADTLRTAGIATSEQDPIAIEDVEWKALNISVVLIRANSFEIWLPLSDSRQMWDALVAAGATPVGTDAMEMWRIAEGLPLYGRDIREKELPQETAQDRALNFTKGCYVGQEIVERIRSRGAVHRTLTGFRFAGDAPAVGTKVIKDGREVGEITSITKLPLASGPIAIGLGYVRREAGAPGTKLDAGGAEATVATLPFSL